MGKDEKTKDILFRRLKHLGLDKAATAARVCAVAGEIAGGPARQSLGEGGEFEPVSFKNGVLKIAVASSSAAHMIRLSQNILIAKVNEKLGQDLVEKIRFEIEQ